MAILLVSIYFLPIIVLLLFAVLWIIPETISDNKWEVYMEAYDKGEKNGKIGKMPVAEDFGYEHIAKKECD